MGFRDTTIALVQYGVYLNDMRASGVHSFRLFFKCWFPRRRANQKMADVMDIKNAMESIFAADQELYRQYISCSNITSEF